MKSWGLSFFFLLVLVAATMLACGSSPRVLQSVAVSPATADAQSFSGGLVQFTSLGYYTTPPSPVEPLAATWGACYQGNLTTGVSVSASGVAHCAAGSVGTYTVWVSVPSNPDHGACPQIANACGGGGCMVAGTAQLTCP